VNLQRIGSAIMALITLIIIVLTISFQLMIGYGICDLETNNNSTEWVCWEVVDEQS